MFLNYAPTRILYVSEPFENSIAVLNLTNLNQPVDLTPASNETSDPNRAANTTLDQGADFYVANRGDNSIVRMRQDGTVVAVRRVRLTDGSSLGNARLNGIAISTDASTIYVTTTGHLPGYGNLEGAVLALSAF